jgi:hypothetical protein
MKGDDMTKLNGDIEELVRLLAKSKNFKELVLSIITDTMPEFAEPTLNETESKILAKFDDFWKTGAWRKFGKKAAFRHFKATVKTKANWIAIQKARNNFNREMAGREPRFIMHGSTWFNNWQDWVEIEDEMAMPPADERKKLIHEAELDYFYMDNPKPDKIEYLRKRFPWYDSHIEKERSKPNAIHN